MKNMFSLYYLLYGEFSSKFVNKKVNSRQGYLTTNNYGSMPIYNRTMGSAKLLFSCVLLALNISFCFFFSIIDRSVINFMDYFIDWKINNLERSGNV